MLEVSPWVVVDRPYHVGVKRLFTGLPLLDTSKAHKQGSHLSFCT